MEERLRWKASTRYMYNTHHRAHKTLCCCMHSLIDQNSPNILSLSVSLSGNHDAYRLLASTDEERDQWIQSIKAAITQGSVYDAFQQRKRRITSVQGLQLPGLE